MLEASLHYIVARTTINTVSWDKTENKKEREKKKLQGLCFRFVIFRFFLFVFSFDWALLGLIWGGEVLLSCLKYPHLKTQEMSDSVVGNTLFQKSGFWFSLGVTFVLKGGRVGGWGRKQNISSRRNYLFNSGSLKPRESSVLYPQVFSVRVRTWSVFRDSPASRILSELVGIWLFFQLKVSCL